MRDEMPEAFLKSAQVVGAALGSTSIRNMPIVSASSRSRSEPFPWNRRGASAKTAHARAQTRTTRPHAPRSLRQTRRIESRDRQLSGTACPARTCSETVAARSCPTALLVSCRVHVKVNNSRACNRARPLRPSARGEQPVEVNSLALPLRRAARLRVPWSGSRPAPCGDRQSLPARRGRRARRGSRSAC